MDRVGALVTLDLSEDSPTLSLPWIITFGPLSDDEEWEPVVCGPYERPHALALAESVVADEELMAVVEPLQPHVFVDRIREDIEAARLAAEKEAHAANNARAELDFASRIAADFAADEPDDVHLTDDDGEPAPPPTADEVREGFARIAARLRDL
jgi:hypothetical protein